VQEGSADVWKKNTLANLELEVWEFVLVGELLAALKRKFGEGDDKSTKVVEFK